MFNMERGHNSAKKYFNGLFLGYAHHLMVQKLPIQFYRIPPSSLLEIDRTKKWLQKDNVYNMERAITLQKKTLK